MHDPIPVLTDDGRDYFHGFGTGAYVRSLLAGEERYDWDEQGRLFRVSLEWRSKQLVSLTPAGSWLRRAMADYAEGRTP
jgi:hypothetical protein